jgi:hypothetical protein
MKEFIEEFRRLVFSSEEKLLKISDMKSNYSPAPGKWSSKQILGHLVDSSYNNITRFINGQFKDDFVFPGYDQEKWVVAQRYDEAEWTFVINIWKNNNLQIARVIEAIPIDVISRAHINHIAMLFFCGIIERKSGFAGISFS